MDIGPEQLFNQRIPGLLNNCLPDYWPGSERVIRHLGNVKKLYRYTSDDLIPYTLAESAGLCFYSGAFNAYTEEIKLQQYAGFSSAIIPDGVSKNIVFDAAIPPVPFRANQRLPYVDKDAWKDIAMEDISYEYVFNEIFKEQASQFAKCGYDLQKGAVIFLIGLGDNPTISLCGAFGDSFYDKLASVKTCGSLIQKHMYTHKEGFLCRRNPAKGGSGAMVNKAVLFDKYRYYNHNYRGYLKRG